jgi:hypothetical protein
LTASLGSAFFKTTFIPFPVSLLAFSETLILALVSAMLTGRVSFIRIATRRLLSALVTLILSGISVHIGIISLVCHLHCLLVCKRFAGATNVPAFSD